MSEYRMTRVKRTWISEALFAFCAHRLQWFSVRPPLSWLLTRELSPFEEKKFNGTYGGGQ